MAEPRRGLSTGTFARRSRLSLKALRLYDQNGLLKPARVDEDTGYRWYDESQLATARLIVMLRGLDLPLAAVCELVLHPPDEAAERLDTLWEERDRRHEAERELVAHLRAKLRGATTALDGLEVGERDVPTQHVRTERRHIGPDELSSWIGRTLTELCEQAGGAEGHPFVVYHGGVDEDGDGPVEVCVPTTKAASTRTEPAHREVYVRLRKARVGFPQILSVFDGLSQWVDTHGLEVAGPAREVYFADFGAAEPTDDVCDVAIPVRR